MQINYINLKRGLRIVSSLFKKKKEGPDYIILGAQKGGTTTLFYQLSQHPQVDNSSIKELHYFDLGYDQPIESYVNFFRDKKRSCITGESSPYYIFHPHAAARIKKHFPKTKFIVLLRNPIKRAYSHYQMMKRRGIDPTETFEEAISRENERIGELYKKMVNNEKENYIDVQMFSYIMRGDYSKQIKVWLDLFPKERFIFIESEEYYANTQKELKKIYSFLKIECIYPKDLETIRHKAEYNPIDSTLYEKYYSYFRELNKELPQLTGRNYSWLK
jgi:lipopolysaccharide transport system ATP-binding protein